MLGRIQTALGVVLLLSTPALQAEDDEEDIRLYMQGRYVFQRNCAVCHGRMGRGDGELAKGVTIKPRTFRKGVFKFRSTPMGKLPTDADLQRTIRTGISGSMMPAFTALSAADLRAVIAYIKQLSPRWDDVALKARPVELPAVPDWFSHAEQHEKHARAGRATFKLHCASCHGEAGEGDGSAAKGLADVWGDPIRPAKLNVAHHRSGDSPSDLFRSVALGLDGTPMVGFLAALGEDKIWDLIAYIESLPPSQEQ